MRPFNSSRPMVHPVDVPPPATEATPGVRMKDMQGMPGTTGGLVLRALQFGFAVISVTVMVTTSDFASASTFIYLVIAVGLQCLWSLSLGMIDIYAILVKRTLRNYKTLRWFAIGDGITSQLTLAAACGTAGITVLIRTDLNKCSLNHCARFEAATAMAFMSWFAASPSFIINYWSLASNKVYDA